MCVSKNLGLKLLIPARTVFRQTKKQKNVLKHHKNVNRFWMLIAVPDCHPKTLQIKKRENEKYLTAGGNQHHNQDIFLEYTLALKNQPPTCLYFSNVFGCQSGTVNVIVKHPVKRSMKTPSLSTQRISHGCRQKVQNLLYQST